jgi:heme-degrading monooxygenase HmoA
MYMLRNEAEVTLGRAADFEALVDEWSTIQGQNAGFVGAALLQSYANPGRYTLFSRWTDREASIAAARRAQFTSFAERLRNSGVLRPTRLTESYESVFEIDKPSASDTSSTAERWVELTLVGPTAAPAVEAHLRKTAELVLQHAPGVDSIRLRRSMGDDSKYLLLIFAADRAAARAMAAGARDPRTHRRRLHPAVPGGHADCGDPPRCQTLCRSGAQPDATHRRSRLSEVVFAELKSSF